jgi:hypothetical protein
MALRVLRQIPRRQRFDRLGDMILPPIRRRIATLADLR